METERIIAKMFSIRSCMLCTNMLAKPNKTYALWDSQGLEILMVALDVQNFQNINLLIHINIKFDTEFWNKKTPDKPKPNQNSNNNENNHNKFKTYLMFRSLFKMYNQTFLHLKTINVSVVKSIHYWKCQCIISLLRSKSSL